LLHQFWCNRGGAWGDPGLGCLKCHLLGGESVAAGGDERDSYKEVTGEARQVRPLRGGSEAGWAGSGGCRVAGMKTPGLLGGRNGRHTARLNDFPADERMRVGD
jgi:hypothetical protein